MRAYFFGNLYLSSIQQGIQAAHCISDIFVEYSSNNNDDKQYDTSKYEYLSTWAKSHKTMILLNGGFSSSIEQLSDFFNHPENPYPCGMFREDDDALNNAITCAGIVLPEKIYDTAKLLRSDAKRKLELRSLDSRIKEDGEYQFIQDDKTIAREISTWELQLCYKLNSFRLAN